MSRSVADKIDLVGDTAARSYCDGDRLRGVHCIGIGNSNYTRVSAA